jgi:hypothetical protein
MGVFFWALHVQVMKEDETNIAEQQLPLIGVNVNQVSIWACAPVVLGLTMLAAIGTLSATTRCKRILCLPEKSDEEFEQLDTNPNALDFIACHMGRLGLLLYPFFLWIVYVEACWIWFRLYKKNNSPPGRMFFMTLGIIILVWCLPLLVRLSFLKIKSMFSKKFL